MRVWDCFPFMDELDVLECRLWETDGQVDVTVIVEGSRTHQGVPRGPVFQGAQERFSRWKDQIRYVVADLPETPADPPAWSGFRPGAHWERSRLQQEAAWQRMEDAEDGDVVFFGDVDEIPRRNLLRTLAPTDDEVLILAQRHHIYGLNWLYPEPWTGTGCARVKWARGNSLHRVRVLRPGARVIHDAGWHLSWFGGPDAVRAKIDSFTHPELADLKPAAEFCAARGIAYDGTRMLPVRWDAAHPDCFPQYVRGGDGKMWWLNETKP